MSWYNSATNIDADILGWRTPNHSELRATKDSIRVKVRRALKDRVRIKLRHIDLVDVK